MSHEGVSSVIPAVTGEVLTTPASLAEAINVSPDAPRASASSLHSPRRVDGNAAIALAAAMAGTTIFAAGMEAQGTGNPNTDPNCNPASPSPIVSESPSGMPSEAPFSTAPDGSPTVTLAPSSSPEPLASSAALAQGGVVAAEAGGNPDCVSPEPSAKAESPYTVDALLNADLGTITKSELKKILTKASKETARYYKANGMVPNANPKEEYAYWNDMFTKATRNGDATKYGYGYATQAVNMVLNVRKVADSGDLKAADAVMDIARAFYRGGFSFLHEKNGQLLSKEKYDGWVVENAIDAEREFGIEIITN